MESLRQAGEAILQACQALKLPMTVDESELPKMGWTLAGNGVSWRHDPQNQSVAFITDADLQAPAVHLAALVREFDVSNLAGSLQDFSVVSRTPSEDVVHYESTLPWPFEPRTFDVQMLFGVGLPPGTARTTALVLGRSVSPSQAPPPPQQQQAHSRQQRAATAATAAIPQQQSDESPAALRAVSASSGLRCTAVGADLPDARSASISTPSAARAGTTQATVHYSCYCITPTSETTCRLRRCINIDMHLPAAMPAALVRSMLVRHYGNDTANLRQQLARLEGSAAAARMQQHPEYYQALAQALAAPLP